MNLSPKHCSGKLKTWLPWLLVLISLPLAFIIFDSGKQSSKWFSDNSAKTAKAAKMSKGKKHKKARMPSGRIVNVAPLLKTNYQPKWQTTGLVKAAEAVRIVSEVAGKVEKINEKAHSGTLLAKGDWLVELDQTDYLLNLRTAQAQLVQAEANFSLELANQQLAKEELSLIEHLDQSIEVALVLREPQLASAKAKVETAKVAVEKSQVALQRTQVKMPFTGKIVSRSVGRGSRVGQNSNLFDIINVERFHLEIKIPRSFLPLLDSNQQVELSQDKLWGKAQVRYANILSVLPELDARDRQVKVLLAIDDPLSLQIKNEPLLAKSAPAIFVHDFLSVSLLGKALEDVWVINDNWLQTDKSIWVVDENNTLQKRAVEIVFKGREKIYVQADFLAGDRALNEKPGIASIGLSVAVKGDINRVNPARKLQANIASSMNKAD